MLTRRHLGLAGLGLAACRFRLATPRQANEEAFEIMKTDEEWKKILTTEQYDVLRQHGTERAGSSPLDKNYAPGTYHCAACDLPLFSSETKFDSGTGWPSFFAPARQRGRHVDGLEAHLPAHGSALPPLRRSSGSRVRRRTEADRQALLHERRGDEVRAEGRELSVLPSPHPPT